MVKYKAYRFIALFLAVNIVFQLFIPIAALALTSGPSQPEVQSFEPAGTSEMVDLFTGDFTYNIPLFELPGPKGGYPFNLHYNSGITMDQEASWVGLGWNLNPGAINRQMRGLPDDFNGDVVHREQDIKPNVTFGVNAGANLEIFGGDGFKGLSLGLGIYYNNFKGVGYSLEPGVNFHGASQEGMTAGLGLNFSLDSQEGIGVNPSLSLGNTTKDQTNQFTMGANFNSRQGLLGTSVSGSSVRTSTQKDKLGRVKNMSQNRIGGGSSISFANPGYAPQIAMPMQGENMSLTVKVGGSVFGIFGSPYVGGFFNTQHIKDKNTSAKAYGYLYQEQSNNDENALLDFNREKDGMIRENTPNLATPTQTFDIYSVSGQGIGGMYRPYRSEHGMVYDQKVFSETMGASGGFDAGFGNPHLGGELTINYSESSSGKWTSDNESGPILRFVGKKSDNPFYEPYYFKSHGEHTSDPVGEMGYVGNNKPYRVSLEGQNAKNTLESEGAQPLAVLNENPEVLNAAGDISNKREPRNTVIQPITNKELLDANGRPLLGEYNLFYHEGINSGSFADFLPKRQDSDKASHLAGVTAYNPDGTRYVYALPAYNTKQEEYQFSVKALSASDGENEWGPKVDFPVTTDPATGEKKINYDIPNTDKFYSKTTTPKFAHSYLLTSVLGADYIDADNEPGPSEGDYGYWVKFTYSKDVKDYKWRVPFTGAHYSRGSNVAAEDDKGSFIYGEKEMWYLTRAETKTHIAIFELSARSDAKGAQEALQRSKDTKIKDGLSYKLNKIKLYSRSEFNNTNKVPIQTVHLEYAPGDPLCKGVDNGESGEGKLTLQQVSFTYGKNSRGLKNPYTFEYNEAIDAENPNYNTHRYDRWGNFKPNPGDAAGRYSNEVGGVFDNINAPYVSQFSTEDVNGAAQKEALNRNMAVWNLKEITLPSGGTIKVDYESDDYGYVQNEVAAQMFKVVNWDNSKDGNKKREVYFDLEKPLEGESEGEIKTELNRLYRPANGQLYFKTFMKLRSGGEALQDFVSGYAKIADITPVTSANATTGKLSCTKAYVTLKQVEINGKAYDYHPFSMAAWQYLRTTRPDAVNPGNYSQDPNSLEGNKEGKIEGLLSIFSEVTTMFKNFYKKAFDEGWGLALDESKSYIRLNSPDKIKFGGGLRVKTITLNDGWEEGASSYGQAYDYTMYETSLFKDKVSNTIKERKELISSGVAAYEPMIGGEEIALRSSLGYSDEIPFATPNNLFAELPVNESLYPGPTVGYRQVMVRSLAAKNKGKDEIPIDINTTGATVHEFYTAKEFPVINTQTQAENIPSQFWIPLPLIGQISEKTITASQGYTIELNDMHGKPKRVSQYREDAKGVLEEKPFSWVQYNYQSKVLRDPSGDRHKDRYVLDNKVKTLISDKDGIAVTAEKTIGQDYEVVTDMRESTTKSTVGGLSINTDVLITPIPIPAFVPWPNIASSKTQVRTSVVNKIIHRSGILASTEAFNDGALIKTENLYYDDLTGEPVVTKTKNNFKDDIYSYSLPAHMQYEGMGAAYKNIGVTFSADLSFDPTTKLYTIPYGTLPLTVFFPGDELICSLGKLYFKEKKDNKAIFYGPSQGAASGAVQTSTGVSFMLIRSGRRNHLNVSAGSLVSKKDPLAGSTVPCNPKNN